MKKTVALILLAIIFTTGKANIATNSDGENNDFQRAAAYIEAEVAKQMVTDGIVPDASYIGKSNSEGKVLISAGPSMFTYIPVLEKDFVIGDLNNDGRADLVAPVYSEFGASGTSVVYYIFVYQQETLYFFKKINASDLGEVVKGALGEAGNFQLTGIKNGSFIGRSDVWLNEDAHCCPSLHYAAMISIQDGIKLIEKAQLKE